MFLNKTDRKGIGTAKVTSRTITGLVSIPFKIVTLLGSLFMILLILGAALLLTKLINDNYKAFQEKIKTDHQFSNVILNLSNAVLGLLGLLQKVLQIALEMWNYAVPAYNLAAYIFYRVVISIILTLFGGGVNQPSTDTGDLAMPMGATPDPVSTLSGDTETFFAMLECILIDILTLIAGVFKVQMRALGACLMVVFDWLDQHLQHVWYRQEYCRKGGTGKMGTTADWSTPTTDPDSGANIYPNGSGPGNTCPNNSFIINALIRFYTVWINILRSIFILIFPLVADLLKMFFDTLMKILPQLMEGIVKIIQIFAPDQPLGKMLMFLINFMIQCLGFFLKSCVLQLMIGIVTCLFNVVAAVVINALRAVLDAVTAIVCLGGNVCDFSLPGDYLSFPSCDWSGFTDCVSQTYDASARNVTAVCQIPTCAKHLNTNYYGMHKNMKTRASQFKDPVDYRAEYHKSCIQAHSGNHSKQEETVAGHLFCRYLTEKIHKPTPLGIDPSTITNPFDDGEDFCAEVQQSCLCKYNSPICESQTCCLTFYSVLVQQIIQDMDMENCDLWDDKKVFAQVYCVSRTQRSLDLGTEDLLGTATHCDGFVALMNQTCYGKPNGTKIDTKGIVGGMCHWVDKAGFCDSYRRPKDMPEGIAKIADFYNSHILGLKEKRNQMMRGAFHHEQTRSPYQETSPHFHMKDYPDIHAAIEDHYAVAMFAMSEAFPMIAGMVLRPSYFNVLGSGMADTELDHNYMTPDGRLRHVRLEHNWDWLDYSGEEIRSVYINGTQYDWHFLGSVPATPYDDAGCTSQSTSGYPSSSQYNCQKNRIGETGKQTGGTITVVTGPGQAQDKVSDMVANSSVPIYQKTTTRSTFSVPANQYVGVMYNTDMHVTSHIDPAADALLEDTNVNWREPLTQKTSGTDRPSGGTIYGSVPTRTQTLEECPVPIDFPWERVFTKRETFLTPLKAFIKQIPEWSEKNIPDHPNIEIPQNIRDGVFLMYTKRKNNLPNDATAMAKTWTAAIKGVYDLKSSWDILRSVKTPNVSPVGEQWWGTSLRGIPEGSNPSFIHNMILGSVPDNSTLCINKLLSPYDCCTDTASAYECCFGLVGCIPPIPMINFTRLNNLDAIANATCDGAGNVVMSMMFIPRLLFGTWLWTLIFISPTWLRVVEFKILYPLVYDYGGLGSSNNFLGDLFCFVVNLYYPILIIMIFFGLYILDVVFLQMFRDIVMKADIAISSVQSAQVKEYAEVHIRELQEQMKVLDEQIGRMQPRQ